MNEYEYERSTPGMREQEAWERQHRRESWWAGLFVTLVIACILGLVATLSWATARMEEHHCTFWQAFTGEGHHYRVDRRCGNCGGILEVWVPVGEPAAGREWSVKCERCGVQNIGVLGADPLRGAVRGMQL